LSFFIMNALPGAASPVDETDERQTS
jgi:hypothetical protein